MTDTNVGLRMVESTAEEEEIERFTATVLGMRQAFRQIKTWIALHRAGELSVDGAFKQIETDADRCLPKGKTEGTK